MLHFECFGGCLSKLGPPSSLLKFKDSRLFNLKLTTVSELAEVREVSSRKDAK